MNSSVQRKIFGRLSILSGNALQITGIVAACLALAAARSAHTKPAAIIAMVAAWVLLYFFGHGIAHWAVGRLLGMQTDKASMQTVSPMAKAIMWSAGVTSSAVVPTLGVLCAWRSGVPGSK